MQKDILEDYMTQAEVAQALKIGIATIARYRKRPDGLPYTVIGGRIYHRISHVQAWLEKQRTVHPNPTRSGRDK